MAVADLRRAVAGARSSPSASCTIAGKVLQEIGDRLRFLDDVGVGYLTLERSSATLSGGESQRIRLATQIGSKLMGVLYVLDEPSIGLHQRDNGAPHRHPQGHARPRQLGAGGRARRGDHPRRRLGDRPRPGRRRARRRDGGRRGRRTWSPRTRRRSPASTCAASSQVPMPGRSGATPATASAGASRARATTTCRNLDVEFPLGLFTVVTGVSGSGKSSLVNDILHAALARHFYRAARRSPARTTRIVGLEELDKVIAIDQSPIGRTPRSNPATYTNVFNQIRALMAKTPEARLRGYDPGRFSFNVKGGRCEACAGEGQIKIEMHFLPDIWVTCEVCGGKRYDRETLAVRYKGLNIAEILDLSVEQAREFFRNIPPIERILSTLDEVGLGYIKLGQPATTLSGGEAQRVKLATELCKRATGRTLYLLDEPTTGLHFDDVRKLLVAAPPAGREGQHGDRRRAQPRRDQDRRLGDRPRPRGRRRRAGSWSRRARRRRWRWRPRATPGSICAAPCRPSGSRSWSRRSRWRRIRSPRRRHGPRGPQCPVLQSRGARTSTGRRCACSTCCAARG